AARVSMVNRKRVISAASAAETTLVAGGFGEGEVGFAGRVGRHGYRGRLGAEAFMPGFDLVLARLKILDGEDTVHLRHIEEGVGNHGAEGHHPGMDVALEAEGGFFDLVEVEIEFR